MAAPRAAAAGTPTSFRSADRWSGRAGWPARRPGKSQRDAGITLLRLCAVPHRPPIPDYEQLTNDEITARLPGLSPAQLSQVDTFERASANRAAVLDRIAALSHPWPDYDDMNVNEIRARLRKEADSALAIQVMDYERRHQARSTVITAASRLSSI
jgi:hypothetical protein